MQVEEGKFYKTRDGRKCGPAVRQQDWWVLGSFSYYNHGERLAVPSPSLDDLIAEWKDEPTGPVTIETVKRINGGVYGIVTVCTYDDTRVKVYLTQTIVKAPELRAAADVFIQLADALEGK